MLQLTDSRGRFRMPEQAAIDALPPEERERFAPVAAAFSAFHAAEREEITATDAVSAELEKYTAAQKVLDRMPKPSFMDLWRSNTTRTDKRA